MAIRSSLGLKSEKYNINFTREQTYVYDYNGYYLYHGYRR